MRASPVVASLSMFSALLLAPAGHAAFRGANGRLAFALTGQPGGVQASGLVTMLPDGGAGAAVGSGGQPDWSPDGRRLTLVVRRGERPSLLYVQAADGSHRRQVRVQALGRYTQGVAG